MNTAITMSVFLFGLTVIAGEHLDDHSLSASDDDSNRLYNNEELFEVKNEKKRSIHYLASDGMKAVLSLLKGANEIDSLNKYTRQFVKSGTYKTALKDFMSLEPKNVSSFKVGKNRGMFGDVGDRTLLVEKRGRTGKPTIRIMRNMGTGKEGADEIIYTIRVRWR